MRGGSVCPSATAYGWTACLAPERAIVMQAGDAVFEADQVVVAMANYQKPSLPEFAP